jgi:hypothetical protein
MAKDYEGPPRDIKELLGSVVRLNGVFRTIIDSSEKLNKSIKESEKQKEDIEKENKDKHKLEQAIVKDATISGLTSKLNEVLAKNLGGTGTGSIKDSLKKAAQYQSQAQKYRNFQNIYNQKINTVLKSIPHLTTQSQFRSAYQRIAGYTAQSTSAGHRSSRFGAAARAAINRGKQSVLKGGGFKPSATGRAVGVFGAIIGKAGIVVAATTKAVEFFQKKIAEAGAIVAKYAHFSAGGLHSAQLLYYRDLQRNIRSSRDLSGSMYDFSKAISDSRDSWRSTQVLLDKVTLALGTFGARLGQDIGKIIDPIAKALDDAGAAIGLWKNKADAARALQERAQRRRDAFQGVPGALGRLEQGDLHPWERGIVNIQNRGIRPFKPPPNAARRKPGADPQQGPNLLPGQAPQGPAPANLPNPNLPAAWGGRPHAPPIGPLNPGGPLVLPNGPAGAGAPGKADLPAIWKTG